jgi:hypothetical protein
MRRPPERSDGDQYSGGARDDHDTLPHSGLLQGVTIIIALCFTDWLLPRAFEPPLDSASCPTAPDICNQ